MKTTDNQSKRRSFMRLIGTGAIIGATSAFARGGRGGRGSTGTSTDTVALTDEQKDTLFFIFQEEKLARDVYITLGKRYPGENTFANIQLSEQEHMLSAQVLCERYGIDTTDVNLSLDDDYVGQFELLTLQEMYNQCIGLGEVSLLEALKVGRQIEITDIADLEQSAEGMPSDVVNTFNKLREGSLNHLDAFERAIARTS